jgi:hypothetical protein
MQLGDTLSIILASGLNHKGLAHASVCGEIVEVREKAVKLQAETEKGKAVSAWFPKKALRRIGEAREMAGSNHQHHTTELARWFKADDWTNRFIQITTQTHWLAG